MSIRSVIQKFNLKPGVRAAIHNRLLGLLNKTSGSQTFTITKHPLLGATFSKSIRCLHEYIVLSCAFQID